MSFILTSLHGDSDLYASKTVKYPSGNQDNELESEKSKGTVDRIDFEQAELAGEYYLGVKGFHADTTYQIEVKTLAKGDNEWSIMEKDPLEHDYSEIFEGFSHHGEMN